MSGTHAGEGRAGKAIKISEGYDYRELGGLVRRVVFPDTVGSENLALSVCYLNPGEEVRVHDHPYEEVYFVVNGRGAMTLGDRKLSLEPLDFVYIPASVRHGQRNTGNDVLVIVCAMSPPPPPAGRGESGAR